ncbi:MAG: Acetate--CoA ligase [Frankiales bacterium]|nr:Acetate--CoA ligase [Frankiales bacterium]
MTEPTSVITSMPDPAAYVWTPTSDYVENANVTRLARRYGIETMPELRARSVADISWYWDAVVQDLGLPFRTPYSTVLDPSGGIEHPEWFVGATSNIVDACIGRWAADPATAGLPAVVHEAEDGRTRTLTYAELDQQVRRASAGLRALGLGRGDSVALFLPMIAEAVVAWYAIARIGAIAVPLFSGFAPAAVAARLQDADAKAVVVADATIRRRRRIDLKRLLDEALVSCPQVAHVVVVSNVEPAGDAGSYPATADPATAHPATAHPATADPATADPATAGRDISWAELVDRTAETGDAQAMTSGEVLLLGYTSGTTGRPKGAVHTHAGFLVKTASEVAYSFDLKVGEVFCWVTDLGWIMGPLSIVGTHANGGALLLYEGSPDVPDLNRLWDLVQRHQVRMLGVSPTLIRTLRTSADVATEDVDLSSVHVVGSTGEPWDPEAYAWLAERVFGGRVPIINFSGGTEVGGSFLAPYPVETIRSCSLGAGSLGMDVDVVDPHGNSVRGEVGELVCRQPWPSMTRGVWKDEQRYLDAYWSTFPGLWRHGDFALVNGEGEWFILGRSDDVMNIAGKRLAPAEIESVVASHAAVAEVAAVGVPDAKKGEAIWVFWVPLAGSESIRAGRDMGTELTSLVAEELGKPFAPSVVVQVEALPKTRSAKIMRRAVRAAVIGSDPGDLSGAENPAAVDELRAIVLGRPR